MIFDKIYKDIDFDLINSIVSWVHQKREIMIHLERPSDILRVINLILKKRYKSDFLVTEIENIRKELVRQKYIISNKAKMLRFRPSYVWDRFWERHLKVTVSILFKEDDWQEEDYYLNIYTK